MLSPPVRSQPEPSSMPESVRKGVRLDIINGFRGVNAAYNHVETRQLELS